MNNVSIIACFFAIVGLGLMMFSMYAIYGGRPANLADAQIGEVFNFVYKQPLHGTPERFLAKVIEPVYTLDERQIARLNRRSSYRRNDSKFQRTSHLVTCQTVDGNIRQFYAERVENCKKPLLAGLVM